MRFVTFLLIFLIHSAAIASAAPNNLIHTSKQLIIVSTPSWNSVNGQMQLFTRRSSNNSWKKVGDPIPVVVGRHGMGWDILFRPTQDHAAIKYSGDGRTPAGIYPLGPSFGFNNDSNDTDYISLKASTVCVDDNKSKYYNRIIDSSNIPVKDWNSGEQMREISQYKLGSVIQYNSKPITPAAGSCIFLHIWKTPTRGTAGCIAMEETNLNKFLNWVNRENNPVIVIFPKNIYENVKFKWKLPNIS